VFNRAETIANPVCLALSAVFLITVLFRVRAILRGSNPRVSIWNNEVGAFNRAAKLLLAVAIALSLAGVIYFVFVATLPSSVIRPYAKTLFCVALSVWAALEVVLCFSIPERLIAGWSPRRISFLFMLVLTGVIAFLLFPNIPKSMPYPAEAECVLLDVPVRGTWLAGHAGASDITNAHWTNRYALDILKLGEDGRFYTEDEDSVTGFYSYGETVYAPADGRVTEVVDGLESDIMGSNDTENPGGNHVVIDIGEGKHLYFAHFRKGSVEVEEGQFVTAGTPVGRVGNSGNSTVPHLHMQVQNKPTAEREGRITYPFRFREMRRKRLILWKNVRNGYLLRNDVFTAVAAPSGGSTRH
jgi:hypothetical protein